MMTLKYVSFSSVRFYFCFLRISIVFILLLKFKAYQLFWIFLMFSTYVGHIIWYTSCCFYYRKATLQLVLSFRSLVLSSLLWFFLRCIFDQFQTSQTLKSNKYFTVFDVILITVFAISIRAVVEMIRVRYEDKLLWVPIANIQSKAQGIQQFIVV